MRTALLTATALLAIFTAASPAFAGRAPGMSEVREPAAVAPVKAPKTAAALSVGGTILGWGLFVGGVALIDTDPDSASTHAGQASTIAGLTLATVGPSAGHIYAGEGTHAVITSTSRAAGGVMMALGMLMVDPIDICFEACEDKGNDAGWVVAGLGAAIVVGTTVYDVIDAPSAARRANRRAARAAVLPTAMRGADGVVPGLVVAGSF